VDRDPYIQRKLSLEFALFEVFVQQQEPHLIDLVLRKPEFKVLVPTTRENNMRLVDNLVFPSRYLSFNSQRSSIIP